jgi:hypothetical protein
MPFAFDFWLIPAPSLHQIAFGVLTGFLTEELPTILPEFEIRSAATLDGRHGISNRWKMFRDWET